MKLTLALCKFHRLGFERVLHQDRVLALGTCRQQRRRAAYQFLDPADVFDGLGRQFGPRARAGGFLLPAGDGFVDRLHARLGVLARRQIIDLLAVEPIADADLDLLEAVEDVELGQSEAADAAGAHRLAHQHGVEPATAPRPAGDDAEFLAALAERLADLVELLGRKRPGADTGGVGLADAEHIAYGIGPKS